MLLVGLTGGIGSGKTTLARMLGKRGAVVVDADDLARRALDPGSPGRDRAVEEFGDGILAPDGSVDRVALSRIVFEDPEKRRALESIVHPEVFRLLQETISRHDDSDTVVVFDAALLVETGFDRACDVVVVVSTPAPEQLRRLRERSMEPEEARRRIRAQIAPEEREERADIVIPNAGDLEELEGRAQDLWERLRGSAGRG